ncbi:MAG TPA: pantoate--beta-alanine ligase, partial [Agriterribacter sp.]|nr:pantoate--beta-alanine ligase [Agriterribacter sp.]
LHIVPTRREENGLAMSSRNMRLSAEEREKAAVIFEALSYIAKNIQPGALTAILTQATGILSRHELRADYVAIAAAG